MVKKTTVIKASAGLLLGIGAIYAPQNVSTTLAAASPKVQTTLNSYVYSAKGKRVGKYVLRRGTLHQTYEKND